MKIKKLLFLIIFIIFLELLNELLSLSRNIKLPQCTQPKPRISNQTYLWSVSHPAFQEKFHLFGTIHVPVQLVWNFISEETKEAFLKADEVYTEIDFTTNNDIKVYHMCSMNKEGKDLQNVISPNLYSRLQRIFDWLKENTEIDVGVSNSWKSFRPEFVSHHYLQRFSTEMFSSLVDIDISDTFCDLGAIATVIPENTTLDMFLALYASILNKKIGGVENARDHCVLDSNLPDEVGSYMLNKTVTAFENIIDLTEEYFDDKITDEYFLESFQDMHEATLAAHAFVPDMVKKYNEVSINENPLETYYKTYTEFISESLMNMTKEDLLDAQYEMKYMEINLSNVIERNMKMTKKIVDFVTANPKKKYFFAFGVAHFLGNNSVVDMLKRVGFTVERVKSVED